VSRFVNVDNFVRAESARMFDAIATRNGGVNQWQHNRHPVGIDEQDVIRSNRDTLYSSAIVDISAGATLTLPDSGSRYLSAMIVNEDHYVNDVYHEPGDHRLSIDAFDTNYVLVGIRMLVDPDDPADVAAVHALQDQLGLNAASARPYVPADFDVASLDHTRTALLELMRGLTGFERAFGRKADVDPVRHLIGTAAGYGGNPQSEAIYLNVDPGLGVGEYELTVGDVPVDAFWSITVYDADGYFIPNAANLYSVNSITAATNDDGSITVHFGNCDDGRPNCLPIADGWNYTVRLYRPRSELLDGTWTFPQLRR
jgi:hypothetical protein